eukprot:9486499-Pyramimonas_sp.AAC.1
MSCTTPAALHEHEEGNISDARIVSTTEQLSIGNTDRVDRDRHINVVCWPYLRSAGTCRLFSAA